jgi:hypothetical protein
VVYFHVLGVFFHFKYGPHGIVLGVLDIPVFKIRPYEKNPLCSIARFDYRFNF